MGSNRDHPTAPRLHCEPSQLLEAIHFYTNDMIFSAAFENTNSRKYRRNVREVLMLRVSSKIYFGDHKK
jgi:hypothetical protein